MRGCPDGFDPSDVYDIPVDDMPDPVEPPEDVDDPGPDPGCRVCGGSGSVLIDPRTAHMGPEYRDTTDCPRCSR